VTRAGSRAAVAAWLLCLAASVSTPVAAHRLDEYLQAVRIDLGFDRILLHVDLTPGAEISSSVLAILDGNGDRTIEAREADGYATLFLRHISLTIDGQSRPLTLVSRVVPSIPEMNAGTGVIRIEASSPSTNTDGPHRLELRNEFRPDVGVYLVNALAPATSEITITSQQRDPLQKTMTLDYEIVRATSWTGVVWWALVFAIVIGFAVWGWRDRGKKRKFAV
jgi:hypothetical protein